MAAASQKKYLKYLEDELHTDVEFLVGESPGTSIKAHKLVLAMRNDVFEAMFYGGLPEQGVVHIPDLHPNGFRGFLRFLYGDVPYDVDTAVQTIRAAQKYLEPTLVNLCTEFVRKSINADNLCFVLDVLKANDEPLFNYDAVINDTLKTNGLRVLCSKPWKAASESTVFEVLRRDKGAGGCYRSPLPEHEIIRAVYEWAHARCSEATGTSYEDRLRAVIKPFLPYIKLLDINSEAFVEGPATWKIFTIDETYQILSNIIKRGSMPLPEFCKT